MTEERHDMLPRIIALLLSLALLAEHAASRPLAERLRICHVFLLAHYAALTLIRFPDEDTLSATLRETPDFSEGGGGIGTLFHLAMVFRAVAAVLMHACLTNGMPRGIKPRHALALSVKLPLHPVRRRFQNSIGFVHDTS